MMNVAPYKDDSGGEEKRLATARRSRRVERKRYARATPPQGPADRL